MDLPSAFFSDQWLWIGHGLLWLCLITALPRADWQRLRENESLHIYLAMTVIVLLLWQIKAAMANGLHLHLLGATILSLMFRWRFALLSMTAVMALDTLYAASDLASLGLNMLTCGIVPVISSYLFALLVRNYLPTHFFVYVFIACFAGAALSAIATMLANTLLLLVATKFTLKHLLPDYVLASSMMAFPEAFITGMAMTLFIVYKPQWVSTFHDDVYLKGK